jgi:hypothetical protein
MPVDASIIPQRQTIPDFGAPLDILQKLASSQKMQQEMAANSAASKAIQGNVNDQGNVDIPSILKALASDPQAAYNLPQMATQLFQMQGAQTTAHTAKLDNIRKQTDALMPIAADWVGKGDKITHSDIQSGLAKAIATGSVTPELAMTHFGTVPKDPKELKSWVDSEVKHLSNAQNALSMITPQFQPNVGGNQPGFVNPYTQTITPAAYAPNAPAPVGVNTPKEPAALNQPEAKLELKYPKRAAGDIAPRLPEEALDTESGQKYVNSLVTGKSELSTANRNIDEVLSKAKKLQKETFQFGKQGNALDIAGDVANKAIRGIHNWANDPDYLEMSKNLANVQLSNMKAQGGGDTDAARSLQAHATGTAVYPPEVLIDIANRAKADMRNIELQATAAKKFAERHGYNNMNTFKDLWGTHADSKLFEMMNLHDNKDMSKEEKLAKRNELMGITPHMSDDEKKARRAEFAKKNDVLEKLVNTGGL